MRGIVPPHDEQGLVPMPLHDEQGLVLPHDLDI